MKARNKHTGEECEVFWLMCDCGRRCAASDKPKHQDEAGYPNYNAVVDDYELFVDGVWVDGLYFIKNPYKTYKMKMEFKKGDRVEICWMSEYMNNLFDGKHPSIGKRGTVVECRYNPNMTVYGMGNEVLVRLDGDKLERLYCDKNLKLVD